MWSVTCLSNRAIARSNKLWLSHYLIAQWRTYMDFHDVMHITYLVFASLLQKKLSRLTVFLADNGWHPICAELHHIITNHLSHIDHCKHVTLIRWSVGWSLIIFLAWLMCPARTGAIISWYNGNILWNILHYVKYVCIQRQLTICSSK